MQPVLLPPWSKSGHHHNLSRVWALCQYIQLMNQANKNNLWVWLDWLKKCETCHIGWECLTQEMWNTPHNSLLRRMINAADPGKLPTSQEGRWVAVTLACLRTHSIDEVQQARQCRSPSSVAEHYLAPNISDTPCGHYGKETFFFLLLWRILLLEQRKLLVQ